MGSVVERRQKQVKRIPTAVCEEYVAGDKDAKKRSIIDCCVFHSSVFSNTSKTTRSSVFERAVALGMGDMEGRSAVQNYMPFHGTSTSMVRAHRDRPRNIA